MQIQFAAGGRQQAANYIRHQRVIIEHALHLRPYHGEIAAIDVTLLLMRLAPWIADQTLAEFVVDQVIRQAAQHVAGRAAAKANRKTHGTVQTQAFMRKTRWDIENVTCFNHRIDDGRERIGMQQRRMGCELAMRTTITDTPVALT